MNKLTLILLLIGNCVILYSQNPKCNKYIDETVRYNITYDFDNSFSNNSSELIQIQKWNVKSPMTGKWEYVGPWDINPWKTEKLLEIKGMTVSNKKNFLVEYYFEFTALGYSETFNELTCVNYNVSYCGDGKTDITPSYESWSSEECDDGNNRDGDGCDCNCKKENIKGNTSPNISFKNEPTELKYMDNNGNWTTASKERRRNTSTARNIVTAIGIGAYFLNTISTNSNRSPKKSSPIQTNTSSFNCYKIGTINDYTACGGYETKTVELICEVLLTRKVFYYSGGKCNDGMFGNKSYSESGYYYNDVYLGNDKEIAYRKACDCN